MRAWSFSLVLGFVVAAASQGVWGIYSATLRHYTFSDGFRVTVTSVADLGWHLFFVTLVIGIGSIVIIIWGLGANVSLVGVLTGTVVVSVSAFFLLGWVSALIVYLVNR